MQNDIWKTKQEMQEATRIFRKNIKEDKDLYWAYQCNIAMSFMDELERSGYKFPEMHEISNKAAKNFLDLWLS